MENRQSARDAARCRLRVLALPLLAVLVAATACNGNDDGPEEAALAGAGDDPCRVFTPAEVLGQLNVPEDDGMQAEVQSVPPIEPAPTGGRYCTYFTSRNQADRPVADVFVGLVLGDASFNRAVFDEWKNEAEAEPVEGLEAEAVAGGSAGQGSGPVLAVFGDKLLFLAITDRATDADSRLERQRRLAAIALDRDLQPVTTTSTTEGGS